MILSPMDTSLAVDRSLNLSVYLSAGGCSVGNLNPLSEKKSNFLTQKTPYTGI